MRRGWGEGAILSECLFTKDANLKKNFLFGGGGELVKVILLTKNPNIKSKKEYLFFLFFGGRMVDGWWGTLE